MTNKIDAWARRQLADYQSNKPGTIFSDRGFQININEAYAIQDTMVKLRLQKGETIAGYKVGCTGPGITKLFGMQGPIRGTLFNQEIYQSGATLNLNQFDNLAIEAEMAFQTGASDQDPDVKHHQQAEQNKADKKENQNQAADVKNTDR